MITRLGARYGIAIGAWTLAACASGPARAPVRDQPSTAAARASDGDAWAKMSWEDHHREMTFLVHPNMARLFQRFEGTAYPELTCRTCHGKDAESVAYAMPHGLPALDPRHMPDPNAKDARGRIAKFMTEEVTPQMAELLDTPPYDPKTGRGFGCFNCHPRAGEAEATKR